jgi:hypothetical protein
MVTNARPVRMLSFKIVTLVDIRMR